MSPWATLMGAATGAPPDPATRPPAAAAAANAAALVTWRSGAYRGAGCHGRTPA